MNHGFWPWMLARRIVWGIMRLCVRKRAVSVTIGGPSAVSVTTGGVARTFSTAIPFAPGVNRIEENTDRVIDDAALFAQGASLASVTTPSGHYAARPGQANARAGSGCPGCARHRPADHADHNRVADVCRYPHTATVRYPCSGWHRGLPRNHPSHPSQFEKEIGAALQ